jgi:HTH-type transcriptional regulator/antitoxin HipB
MDMIVRNAKQLGASIRRVRRAKNWNQNLLGDRMHVRQATISKLESGEPRTEIGVLMATLAALDLELVIRPRTTISETEIEELF